MDPFTLDPLLDQFLANLIALGGGTRVQAVTQGSGRMQLSCTGGEGACSVELSAILALVHRGLLILRAVEADVVEVRVSALGWLHHASRQEPAAAQHWWSSASR